MPMPASFARTIPLAAAFFLSMTFVAWAQMGSGSFGLTGDQPVQVDGDRLEVLDEQGVAIFEGNVRVIQGETVIRTGRLVIHYAGEGAASGQQSQIERLEASGGINIQSEGQSATGERGTYDMVSETLVLAGERVTLSEGGNVATGCLLTVDLAAGRSLLEGCEGEASRPTVILQPQNR